MNLNPPINIDAAPREVVLNIGPVNNKLFSNDVFLKMAHQSISQKCVAANIHTCIFKYATTYA